MQMCKIPTSRLDNHLTENREHVKTAYKMTDLIWVDNDQKYIDPKGPHQLQIYLGL